MRKNRDNIVYCDTAWKYIVILYLSIYFPCILPQDNAPFSKRLPYRVLTHRLRTRDVLGLGP